LKQEPRSKNQEAITKKQEPRKKREEGRRKKEEGFSYVACKPYSLQNLIVQNIILIRT